MEATLADLLFVFAASFGFIFAKAFQQRNVMGAHYKLIATFSYLMALTEVYVVWSIAKYGPSPGMVVALGTAGASGSIIATWLHKRHVTERGTRSG